MRKLIAALRRLDDHPLGDVIALACLFGLLYVGLFAEVIFGGAK